MDYDVSQLNRIKHDFKGLVRRQEVIFNLALDAIQEQKKIDPRFVTDMDHAISSIADLWVQLKNSAISF